MITVNIYAVGALGADLVVSVGFVGPAILWVLLKIYAKKYIPLEPRVKNVRGVLRGVGVERLCLM